jgi:hypothetical protein
VLRGHSGTARSQRGMAPLWLLFLFGSSLLFGVASGALLAGLASPRSTAAYVVSVALIVSKAAATPPLPPTSLPPLAADGSECSVSAECSVEPGSVDAECASGYCLSRGVMRGPPVCGSLGSLGRGSSSCSSDSDCLTFPSALGSGANGRIQGVCNGGECRIPAMAACSCFSDARLADQYCFEGGFCETSETGSFQPMFQPRCAPLAPPSPPPIPSSPPSPPSPLSPPSVAAASDAELRSLIEGATKDVSIFLAPGLHLKLSSQIRCSSNVKVVVASSDEGAKLDGQGTTGLFLLTESCSLTLRGLAIVNGRANYGPYSGQRGGVVVGVGAGDVEIIDSTVTGCTAEVRRV